MVDTIFRLTNSGDTEASVADTEKIEFNAGTVPDSTGKLINIGIRMATDLNPHPNPDISLTPFQDSLLGPLEVTIAGYFVNRNFTIGPTNLKLWAKQPKETDDFENGRFGLSLAALNSALNLIPTTGINGTGYEISEIDIQNIGDPPKATFIVKLLQNGKITISVTAINITSGGSGYVSAPTVTIDAPPAGGTTATATATITDDVVTAITITDNGSGYETQPNVSLTGNATAEAFIS